MRRAGAVEGFLLREKGNKAHLLALDWPLEHYFEGTERMERQLVPNIFFVSGEKGRSLLHSACASSNEKVIEEGSHQSGRIIF